MTSYWDTLIGEFTAQPHISFEGYACDIQNKKEKADPWHYDTLTLTAELSVAIQQFTSQQHLSPLTLIYSAWALLLNRMALANDLLFGSGELTIDKQITLPFMPVRSQLEPATAATSPTTCSEETACIGITLLDFCKQMNVQLRTSRAQLPTLAQATLPGGFDRYLLLLTAGDINAVSLPCSPADHPLVLRVCPQQTDTLALASASHIFTAESHAQLIEHLLLIIAKIVATPNQAVSHFSILTPADHEKLTCFSQPHVVALTQGGVLASVHEQFTRMALQAPQALAVSYHETIMNYQQLDALSNQIAHFLHKKNLRAGDTVAVLMERSPLLIATMLGIFKADVVFVPINPKYPDDRIQFILNDCTAHLILVNNTQRIPQDFLYRTTVLDEHAGQLKSFPTTPLNTLLNKNKEDIAYIIYTSGTTGHPKGVMINHISITNLAHWYKTHFRLQACDRASQFNSAGFDAFFCEVLPTIAVGASIHIIDDSNKLSPNQFLDWLATSKITICDLPTAYGQILFNLPWPAVPQLRLIKIGGESISHYPKQVFTFDIWNTYGPTEGTIETTYHKIFSANLALDQQPCQHLPPPIGKPLHNVYCHIVDAHLQRVPPGCIGELLIGGINLSPGYFNRAQLTREKFVPDIFSDNPAARLYRTGDLARWLPDGSIEYIGRLDHQIKIRGYRIELGEIEAALSQYPDVNEVMVLARENVSGQKTLVAWLVPNLERIRVPWQERCLLGAEGSQYHQIYSEDISREGIAISSIPDDTVVGQKIRINIKLPGSSDPTWLTGQIAWRYEQRAGVHFDQNEKQQPLLKKSIEFYLATHNLMDTLQSAAAKRNLKKALKKKLPEYMIPSVFSIQPRLPLTFNGKIDWKALPPPQDFERLLERTHVAPRNATEQAISDIWCEVLDIPTMSMTDNFFDLGGNSLKVAHLSVKLLEKFKLAIPAKILFDLPFIPIMAEYIDSNGEKFTDNSRIQEEISRDVILNDDIMPTKILRSHLNQPKEILLTGAAGFLGLFLLRDLLQNTEAKIYCLIRKGGFETIASRMMMQLEQFGLSADVSLANRRIALIPGDISLHQFGLPAELYDNLVKKVDCIYHCGAQVNTMAAYTHLRGSNVQGTIEVIRFATQGHDKPIYYVSTLSAASTLDTNGRFAESWPEPHATGLYGGYAISKWVSERLLVQAMQRGLPIQIFRSGYILGEVKTGITNLNDALLLLVKGCIQLGVAPDWKESITLLPVDFISRAIVGIASHQPSKCGVYHLDNPLGLLWVDFMNWFAQQGYRIKCVPHAEWLQKLAAAGRDNALYPFLPHYLSLPTPPETPPTAMDNTQQLLEKINIPYPVIGDAALRVYLDFLLDKKFLPQPAEYKTTAAI